MVPRREDGEGSGRAVQCWVEGGSQGWESQCGCKPSVSCICLIDLTTRPVYNQSSGQTLKRRWRRARERFIKNEAIPSPNENEKGDPQNGSTCKGVCQAWRHPTPEHNHINAEGEIDTTKLHIQYDDDDQESLQTECLLKQKAAPGLSFQVPGCFCGCG